jgi:bla regulator protein BlaR1
LLTLALRRNHARVRHWVWLAASCKFLIPLSVLIALGGDIRWRTTPEITPSNFSVVMDEISQPFTARAAAASAPLLPPAPSAANPIPTVLWGVWMCGFLGIACAWWLRWRRIRTAVRAGSLVRLDIPVRVVSSPSLLEPGVFGVIRPVLLLPEGICERLTRAQLEAIVAHELCHVRHRDNLIAAIHMFVETVFWFHPLVWWIGKRMVEERERACDEEVLRLGSDPRVYAEGILNVCRLYVESPLTCVAGVTGSNLKKRIEEIMADRMVVKANAGRKLLLAGVGMLAVTGPVAIGLVNASQIGAQSQPTKALEFEAASVKPDAQGDRNFRPPAFLPGRFVSRAPLQMAISFAYNLPFNPSVRLTGVPEWARSMDTAYDIEATVGVMPAGLSDKARLDRVRAMLQTLLADRFKLVIHRETREMPVYALVVGKGGPKLQKADIEEKDCPDPSATPPPAPDAFCHDIHGGRGRGLHGRAVDMSDLASEVENWTDRPLLDKTGIKGLYHIETTGWLPMQPGPPPAAGAKGEDGTDLADMPTIFEVFDRLGLKMEPQRDRADIYVVDHVEKPSEN